MRITKRLLCIVLLVHLTVTIVYSWLTKEAADWAIQEFKLHEKQNPQIRQRSYKDTKNKDRKPSNPFISGDGFRARCQHICEDAKGNECTMKPSEVKDGDCIFVKNGRPFMTFIENILIDIKVRYLLIVHNDDYGVPDAQTDQPYKNDPQMKHMTSGNPQYHASELLMKEYLAGKLIALHTQNSWWRNWTTTPRPSYLHCLPIGIENRMWKIGVRPGVYTASLKKNFVDRPILSIEEQTKKKLLLVAFTPIYYAPDRVKALHILGMQATKGGYEYKQNLDFLPYPRSSPPFGNFTNATVTGSVSIPHRPPKPFFTFLSKKTPHQQWLDAIYNHRFTLCPFGHGMDTHRLTEVLLMGGIPVLRRSALSSCYDDSDNDQPQTYSNSGSGSINGDNNGTSRRGSLPIVWIDKWEEVTQEFLELEWQRLSAFPVEHWDWRRLFINHWVERIGFH